MPARRLPAGRVRTVGAGGFSDCFAAAIAVNMCATTSGLMTSSTATIEPSLLWSEASTFAPGVPIPEETGRESPFGKLAGFGDLGLVNGVVALCGAADAMRVSGTVNERLESV